MKLLIVEPEKYSARNYILKTTDRKGNVIYIVMTELWYKSSRYDKYIVCEIGDVSDGATGAYDINSFGWLFHDELCNTGKFNDGTECNNWQASKVLSDILKDEGRWFRKVTWFWSTWLFGCGKARKNGMY